jgi:hypothetical protein
VSPLLVTRLLTFLTSLVLLSIVLARQVKWLAKGQDRVETLISISTDGNVLQWSLKKGLLVSVLMQLKRGGAVRRLTR